MPDNQPKTQKPLSQLNKNTLQIASVLAFIVFLGGMIVSISWLRKDVLIEQLQPDLVSMKFSAALSFVMSGIILMMIAFHIKKFSNWAYVALPMISFVVFILMSTVLISVITNVDSSIDSLFRVKDVTPVLSLAPGVPSLATSALFFVIATNGVLAMYRPRRLKKCFQVSSAILIFFSLVALLGYVISAPLLYYFVEGVSTAMSVNTAVLFLLSGISLYLIGRSIERTQAHAD